MRIFSLKHKDFHHFFVNVTIGIVIAIFLWYFHNAPLPKEIDNIGVDWIMKLYRGTSSDSDIPHFVAVEIDDKTYREWGEQLITPRDKLQQLIESAVKAQPRLIIVDIELNTPSEPEKDNKLLNYLNQYVKSCPESTPCPHIIFARGVKGEYDENKAKNYWIQRKSFGNLDQIVAGSPYLHWASVLFRSPSLECSNLRYWHLSAPTYMEANPSQIDVVLPSVQLLTLVLMKNTQGKDTFERVKELKHKLQPLTQQTEEKEIMLKDGKKIDLTSSDDLSSRVIYTLPWKNEKGKSYPPTKEGMLFLNPIPAHSLNPAHNSLLAGSIVVIGGSYQDSRDIHPTPLGSMPGYLVLINSILSLDRFGQLKPISLKKYLFIEGFLIILISFIFVKFNSLKSMLILTFLIVIVLTPVSVYIFQLGIWLSFLIPLIGVFFHQFHAYIGELQELANRQRSQDLQ